MLKIKAVFNIDTLYIHIRNINDVEIMRLDATSLTIFIAFFYYADAYICKAHLSTLFIVKAVSNIGMILLFI